MKEHEERIHRVGTVTLGLCLIVFGILFLINMIVPQIDYWMICRFWPAVFIVLGTEVLFSCKRENVVYDKWGIVLLMCLLLFSMGMGMIDMTGTRLHRELERPQEISQMTES